MTENAGDRGSSSHFAFRRVIQIRHRGNLANKMLQYMGALTLADRIKDCTIVNVSLPEWGIEIPDDTQNQSFFDNVDLWTWDPFRPHVEELTAMANKSQSIRIIMGDHLLRMEFLLPPPFYNQFFPKTATSSHEFSDMDLLINIRSAEILNGVPHYPLMPVDFYEDIVTRTGLNPVFMGQLQPSTYVRLLRERFPGARFIESQGAIADFNTIRSAKNIVVAISTFSWLAAWLSEARNIILPLNGFFNPAHHREVDLLPVDDTRYRFFLFPLNYGLPEKDSLAHHQRMRGYWKEISRNQAALLKSGTPFLRSPRQTYENGLPSTVARGSSITFDPIWYAHQYIDAAMEISEGWFEDPLHHYLEVGRLRGDLPTRPIGDGIPLDIALPNIALNKPATQSSLSRWSKGATLEQDAGNAVNGVPSKDYAFCTNNDPSPWWMVDLERPAQVHFIRIFNRDRTPESTQLRASPLIVETSSDGERWNLLFSTPPGHLFGGYSGGRPLVWSTKDPVETRYVRVSVPRREHLHLAEVEIYGRFNVESGASTTSASTTAVAATEPSPQGQGTHQATRDITVFFMLPDDPYVADFLSSIHNQSYDKRHIHLFVGTSNTTASAVDVFQYFITKHGSEYRSISIFGNTPLMEIRKLAIVYCQTNVTDFFTIDGNIIIHPKTLRRLADLNLDVVAPMLVFDGSYSNFHADVDDRGYYRSGETYYKILKRQVSGAINVPVVNACYLLRNECLKYANYEDRSGRADYVIFSDNLRKNAIPQYIDNTFNYGILLNVLSKSVQNIKDADALNNKRFYLGINNTKKRGVICDADWLSTFVADEHLYLLRILQDEYDFHIINCNRLDVRGADFVEDLNSYDVLLIAYHVYCKIPLDGVTAYKIYKIDDMQNDPEYTKIVNFNIKHCDMIISPYAYVFDEFYKHDNVVWVPYSCALESYEDWKAIKFNENPTNKIFQSGNVAWSYPFRKYVASLSHEGLEKMPHQGWRKQSGGGGEQIIGLKYYRKLNEYLCCFTDALTFRYIVLKNFEIAATGSLLLTDKAVEPEMNELGFIDRQTCLFCDRETFLEKVEWILDPQNRREVDAIRRAGMELVHGKHMTRHRAAQIDRLADKLTRASAIPTEESTQGIQNTFAAEGFDIHPASWE